MVFEMKLEKEFEVWRKQHHGILTDEDRQRILALGEDLPKLWSATSMTQCRLKNSSRAFEYYYLTIRKGLAIGSCVEGLGGCRHSWGGELATVTALMRPGRNGL